MKESNRYSFYLKLVKKLNYLTIFLCSIIAMMIFKKINIKICAANTYILLNVTIFISALILFMILAFYIFGRDILHNKKLILYSIVTIVCFVFVFIVLRNSFFGRVAIVGLFMGNAFIEEIFVRYISYNYRTYSLVFYSLLETVFHLKITPMTILFVNKIFSILLLTTLFVITYKLFKGTWISIFALLAFVSSVFIQLNLTSIEATIIAIYFTYSAVLFLLLFVQKKQVIYFVLSNLGIILAAYYRFELAFLLGVPYIIYYSIFMKDNDENKKTEKYMLITLIVLIQKFMVFVAVHSRNVDSHLSGENQVGSSILSYITNAFYVFNNNILINKGLALSSGYATLFTYSGIAISIVVVGFLTYSLLYKKLIPKKHNLIYFFAFYNLFYFIFQVFFHIDGLRSAHRYSVNYYFCEIILTFYAILWGIEKIEKTKILNEDAGVLKLYSIGVFLAVAIGSSPSLTIRPVIHEQLELKEIKAFSRISLDKECGIIKVHPEQPKIDYFTALQKNAVYFSDLGSDLDKFYNNLKNHEKKGRCFYYYDEKVQEITNKSKIDMGTYEFYHGINSNNVKSIFNKCSEEVELEIPTRILFEGKIINITKELIKFEC